MDEDPARSPGANLANRAVTPDADALVRAWLSGKGLRSARAIAPDRGPASSFAPPPRCRSLRSPLPPNPIVVPSAPTHRTDFGLGRALAQRPDHAGRVHTTSNLRTAMTLGLLAVFTAGVLTLATPCVLPMIPVYLAMVTGTSSAAASRAGRNKTVLVGAALFVAGFATVFTLLGMAATSAGAALAAHRTTLLLVAAAVMVAFGLKELSILKVPWLDRTLALRGVETNNFALNAFGLGFVFALGWTPCVGPILGSVLTFTASRTSSPAQGALHLLVYALGVGLPLLAFAWLGDRALAASRRLARHLPLLERVTGMLLVLGGLITAIPAARTFLAESRSDGSTPATGVAAAEGRPALLAFHSPSCPSCQKMAPRVAELERDCASKHIDILSVDVAEPEGYRLATRYNVVQVPTILFLAADRTSEAVLVGEHTLTDLRATASRLLRAACGAVTPSTAANGLGDPAHGEPTSGKPSDTPPTGAIPRVIAPTAPVDPVRASCAMPPRSEAGAHSLSCSG